MRVTNETIQRSTLRNLQTNLSAMSTLQAEMSSGKRIQVPSDDPSGTGQSLSLRAMASQLSQYQRNGQDGDSWLTTVDTALTTALGYLRNARDLVVQSGDAETLYTAPENAFAAGFIGNYNLLDAAQATRLLDRPFRQQVAIRPESLRLSVEPGEGIPVRVLSHSLLGNVIRYRVDANGVELTVDVLNRSAERLYPAGTQLGLQIDSESIREVA